MKKTLLPIVMTFVMLMFSLQTLAQRFYDRGNDPVAEIVPGTRYALQNPWTGDYHMLCGTGTINTVIDRAVYIFEVAGQDVDGNTLYRLKQEVTGEYLEDPNLSRGVVSMTKSASRAFVFTALPGVAVDSAEDLDGDGKEETTTEEWKNADRRTKYEPADQTFENVFVFCNKDEKSQYQVFEIFGNGYGCMWNQFTNARVWYLYEIQETSAYNNLCYALAYYVPEGVEGKFVAGTAPGQVPAEYVDELKAAYDEAKALENNEGEADEVYYNAIDRLAKALDNCKKQFTPVTAGYYVIDNNPAAGRPAYAGTSNACMLDTLGQLHWAGFNKPEVMNVAGASYIWELIPAEKGGWYLRNYGTKRYAGSLNKNYQCVPSSEKPKQIYDINYRGGQYFSMDMRGQNADYPALHADQNDGLRIVIWTSGAGASLWSFIPVAASELEGIEGELEQAKLNKEAKALLGEAQTNYQRGFTYSAEGCTRDGSFNLGDGLITEAAGLNEEGGQLSSNAMENPDNESGNCYKNLLDGEFTTYFHTVWSDAAYASSFHHLDIRLNEAVKTFNIKYAKRHNNTNGSPTKIHVYASNDTTGGQWTDQGYMNCTYPWSTEFDLDGEKVTKNNFVGVAGIELDDNYTYVRLSVEGTEGMSRTNGNLYWYWSELRLFKSHYDPSLSLIEAVPAEIKNELVKQMKAVESELAAGKVTKATFEAFQAAYKKFMDNYPDSQIVKNLLGEAKAQAEAATEGEDLGYFKVGAVEELNAALKIVEASIKDVMTVAEVNNAKEQIEAALNAFMSKLNVPADGALCYIKSAAAPAENSPTDSYLFAQNNDESQVKYAVVEDTSNLPNYLWKTVKNADGSYSFMNVGTGTYLGNPKKNNVKVNMALEPDTFKLSSAKLAGVFNFVCGSKVYLNAQPKSGNLVTWNSASGADNSAFIIETLDNASNVWDGESVKLGITGKPQVVSLPYEIVGTASSGSVYKVLGIKDGKLQLGLYSETENIPAATPFIFVPEEGAVDNVFFLPEPKLEGLTYVFEGHLQNGLQATIQSRTDIVGGGVLFDGNVIPAVEGDVSTANSGFFAEMPTETTEVGDLEMTFPTEITTAIEEVELAPVAKSGVYSLTGVKVRQNNNVNNLPKGVYIVGGQKVIVK